MKARVGDRIVIEGTHTGEPRRIGVVTQVEHPDGAPPYEVTWLGTGRKTLIFPGAEAHVEASES